jgi:hypothetical protein
VPVPLIILLVLLVVAVLAGGNRYRDGSYRTHASCGGVALAILVVFLLIRFH